MTLVALQGLHGGVGTTSITAGLAWALKQLGESVLAIDLCPDNMLRLHFNTPFDLPRGWAKAELEQTPWQQSAMRYVDGLDFLPFGQLSLAELSEWNKAETSPFERWADYLNQLKNANAYRWILLDMPFAYPPVTQALTDLIDIQICLIQPNMNNHIRLYQQELPRNCRLLVNKFSTSSILEEDLHLLWLQSLRQLLPLTIHRDEALAEALAMKKPIGQYSSDSVATNEIMTLANWCLIHATRLKR